MESQRLLWLDLEMTGLNVTVDHIIEVAALVTDATAHHLLSEVFHAIPFQSDQVLSLMGPWVKDQHTRTGLIELVKKSDMAIEQIDVDLSKYISHYGPKNHFILAGNSIWQDRLFVQKYLPLTHSYLHYRMIDVTAIKQLVRTWYKDDQNAFFIKKEAHRAADDLYESIHELLHYKEFFFK